MKRIFRITLALAVWAGTIHAGLLEYTPYGSPVYSYNATGMALNMRGVALSGQGLSANPALLTESEGLDVQITLGINWRREYRSIEVFDSYANSVGLRTTSINDQTDYNFNHAEASYTTNVLPRKMALGFGVSREYDFNYRLKNEERDAFYYMTEIYQQEMKGAIYGYSGALAVKPISFLSLGLGLTRLAGKPTLSITDNYTDPIYTDLFTQYQFDYSGTRFMAGLLGNFTQRLKFGISWKSSSRMEGLLNYQDNDTTITATQKVGLPSTISAGFSYRPANDFPATVCLEYEHIPWQNLEDNLFKYKTMSAVDRYSFGIIHRMRNGQPLMFGVSFANSYLSSSIGLARAGIGTELSAYGVNTGISAGVGRRTYNYGQAFGTSSGTTISETMADLMLTFSLK
jgi:hypothetical protein